MPAQDHANVTRSTAFLPELAALSVVTIWGSTFTTTKALYADMHPLAFGFWRFLVIILIAWLVLRTQSRRANRPDWLRVQRQDLPLFALTGLCGYTFYQLGFLLGLERTSPFSGSLMISLQPLVTLVLVTLLGERQSALVWSGAVIALVGITIFLFSRDGESSALGNLICFLGAVAFALYQVFNRRLVREYPASTYAFYSTFLGAIPLLVIAAPAGFQQDWGDISLGNWLIFIYMCIFPVYLAYILWTWAIRHRGVAITGMSLLVPVVAGLMAWAFAGEHFDARKMIGGGIAVVGLLVMQQANRLQQSSSGH